MLGITVREMVGCAAQQAACMKAVADTFDAAAAMSPMDLSVEAEAFGSAVRFCDNEVPTVTDVIVSDNRGADRLTVPAVGAGRSGVCVEAIARAKALIVDRPVIAGLIGPFSLAGRLMDMTEIMVKCLLEPEQTHVVLDKATAFIIEYARALKRAGADGVLLAEPAAGLLSPVVCETFSSCYVKRIVDAVQDDAFAVIYHNCGNTLPLIPSLVGIGARAYHFGDAVDISEVLARMPPETSVLGNLSPSAQFLHGTPESVTAATRTMLRAGWGHANYRPSSGCDIPPLTPFANIRAFFEAVQGFVSRDAAIGQPVSAAM